MTDLPQNDQQCTWTPANPLPRNNRIFPVHCLLLVRALHRNHIHYQLSLIFLFIRVDNIHPNASDFVIVAGAILGLCAGLLWTAQGCMMMAYPTEAQKGVFIGIFWAIFNLGAVIGSAVALGLNFNNQVRGSALMLNFIVEHLRRVVQVSSRLEHRHNQSDFDSSSWKRYLCECFITSQRIFTLESTQHQIGFLILTLIGVALAPLMADPGRIVRIDGTKVTLHHQPSWKTEFYSLYVALRTDPMIVLLFPMFVASNYFYTWRKCPVLTFCPPR